MYEVSGVGVGGSYSIVEYKGYTSNAFNTRQHTFLKSKPRRAIFYTLPPPECSSVSQTWGKRSMHRPFRVAVTVHMAHLHWAHF